MQKYVAVKSKLISFVVSWVWLTLGSSRHQLLFFAAYTQLPVAASSLVFLLVNISFLLLKKVLLPVTMLSFTALASWLISLCIYNSCLTL